MLNEVASLPLGGLISPCPSHSGALRAPPFKSIAESQLMPENETEAAPSVSTSTKAANVSDQVGIFPMARLEPWTLATECLLCYLEKQGQATLADVVKFQDQTIEETFNRLLESVQLFTQVAGVLVSARPLRPRARVRKEAGNTFELRNSSALFRVAARNRARLERERQEYDATIAQEVEALAGLPAE